VIHRLLARLEQAIVEVERTPALDAEACRRLGRFCRYMVWTFLSTSQPTA
jgi:hypothetical protein